ncbi:MAG: MFS transporter [Caulobacteraceae bacterium]|nr:MFS transporter [Caulobacter sp.]
MTTLAEEAALAGAAEAPANRRVIVALVATYVLYAVLLNSVGTVILQAVRTFGVGKGEASLLEGCKDLSIAGVSFLLASSLPRIGYRRALVAGLLALAAACAAMPLVASFWMTALAFLVTGATFGLAKVAVYGGIGLVAAEPRRHASLTSLVEGLFVAGVVGGYWLFAAFIPAEGSGGAGWLDVYWVLAVASVAVAGLWLFTPLDERRLHGSEGGAGASFAAMLALLLRPFVGVFLLCAFLYVLIEQSLGSWMPTFNHEVLKLSPQLSVQLASVYAASLCLGRLGGSAVLRRFSRFTVLYACVAGMAALLALALAATRGLGARPVEAWAQLPPQALILPAIGLLMSVIYPTLNSVVLSALPVERQAGMTGLIVVFSALGGTLGSFLTGRAFAAFGGREAVAGALIPIALLFAGLIALSRLTHRGPPSPRARA